jgi:hypothetical protein
VCTKAGTVLRTVALDFFFNCCYLENPSDNRNFMIPHCIGDGEDIIPTRPIALYLQESSSYSYFSEVQSTPRAIVRFGRIKSIENSSDFENRTCYLRRVA